MSVKLVLIKGCPKILDEDLKLVAKFVKYAIQSLQLDSVDITIRMLGANPNERITTGAYDTGNKAVSVIVAGRHLVDYCRTIAHELVHMKQDTNGELNVPHPEIGGKIEDEANYMAGRFVKHFIKNILTPEEKARLGLGSYGSQNEIRKIIREAINEVLEENNKFN
jgi:Zn-dependent peptidase ImmA (M78 family)